MKGASRFVIFLKKIVGIHKHLYGEKEKKGSFLLQVPSSQKKERNETIEFFWGLYCFVVLFLLFK